MGAVAALGKQTREKWTVSAISTTHFNC